MPLTCSRIRFSNITNGVKNNVWQHHDEFQRLQITILGHDVNRHHLFSRGDEIMHLQFLSVLPQSNVYDDLGFVVRLFVQVRGETEKAKKTPTYCTSIIGVQNASLVVPC